MNILELTGMTSTKYGGLESYFVELVKTCKGDKFYFVYELMPYNEKYVSDISKYGGGNFLSFSSLCIIVFEICYKYYQS